MTKRDEFIQNWMHPHWNGSTIQDFKSDLEGVIQEALGASGSAFLRGDDRYIVPPCPPKAITTQTPYVPSKLEYLTANALGGWSGAPPRERAYAAVEAARHTVEYLKNGKDEDEEWISIKDYLPLFEVEVRVYTKSGGMDSCIRKIDHGRNEAFWISTKGCRINQEDILYWHRLPMPPKK